MCGIAGVYNLDLKAVDKSVLSKMNESMSLRGPDDDGYYYHKNFAMAMRRLSIIDLKKGKQPISNEDKTIHVVFNGEIYNYIEIKENLTKKGYSFLTNSDTEVIVKLYEEYGLNAVDYLNGMFSFSLYDEKKQRLWIARDRLGIKPLYYFKNSECFAYASDLNALAKHPLLQKNLDIESMLLFLTLAYVPTPRTIWKNAKKLPPGHWILIDNNKFEIKKYWEIKPSINESIDVEKFYKKIKFSFEESIEFRSRSDVPVGTFLSGGLDSSAVTALFCQKSNKSVDTFTMDFEGKNNNENYFAKLVSDKYSTNHHYHNLNIENGLDELDELIPLLDEPLADSAIIPSYFLSKSAKNKNIKVVLCGAGGDELFGGYGRHFFKKRDLLAGRLNFLPRGFFNKIGFFNQRLVHYLSIAKDKGLSFAISTSGVQIDILQSLLIDKNLFNIAIDLTQEKFSKLNMLEEKHGHNYSRMLTDINNYLLDNVLSITDKTTMAASVEARVPLLDHNLVELAFSVNSETNLGKSNYSNSKQSLKKALVDYIPKEILLREKSGFNAPIDYWLKSKNKKIEDRLKNLSNDSIKKIIDQKSLNDIWLNENKRNRGSESLFMIYILDKWLQHHA